MPSVPFDEMLFNDEYKSFIKLKEFLFDNCKLFFDESDRERCDEEMKKTGLGNPFLKALFRRGTTQQADFFHHKFLRDQDYIDEHKPNMVQFIENDLINKSNGNLSISPLNWHDDILALSQDYEYHLKGNKEKTTEWKFLKSISLPINSLVLADPYFINSLQNKSNFQSLIDAVLPSECEGRDFHFSIIYCKAKNDVDTITDSEKVKFKNIISNIKRQYNLVFSFHKTNSEHLHDRSILANYWRLSSGHSFDYFNHSSIKGNKNTTINFVGLNSSNKNKVYENIRLDFKRIINNSDHYYTSRKFKNRLIEY
jgi:hypothetical protein